MYYAESASIEPFFISTHDLEIHKWPEVKKEAEKLVFFHLTIDDLRLTNVVFESTFSLSANNYI